MRVDAKVAGFHPAPATPPPVLNRQSAIPKNAPLTLVSYVLPSVMVEVREYLDRQGSCRFAVWFESLDETAAAKVTMAIARLGQGNFSNVKGAGSGVLEYRIDFGPGYRIYFGKDGDCRVILLGGG
jgi:putative addiction module killer protein